MTSRSRRCVALAVAALLLAAAACGTAGGQTPDATSTSPSAAPAAASRCGDGICDDTVSQPITLQDGKTAEFQLGVIQAAGSFELCDVAGNRLGLGGTDSTLVVPDTCRVKLADGRTVDGVVVETEEVMVIK